MQGAFVAVRDLQGEPEVEQISQSAGAGLSVPCMRREPILALNLAMRLEPSAPLMAIALRFSKFR
jgi:hypothetical protein